MRPSAWQRIKEIVGDAVEQRPADRPAFVRQASNGDQEVEREALRLLASHDEPDVELDGPPLSKGMLDAASQLNVFYPGEKLAGRYIIRRFLAAGGMGEVYEAEDTELAERIAIKTLHPEIARTDHVVWLRREIQAARKISHPNVCRVYDLVETETGDGRPIVFLTMELLEGENLSRRLEREGALSERQALPLVRQMVAALAAAHQQGIVHRDFKTGNIMIVPRPGAAPRLVVTDFGLARPENAGVRQSSSSSPRSTTVTLGTPAYMAPEQVEGTKVGPAADIYALGVVIYELLTGELPFSDESPLRMMMLKMRKQPDSLTRLAPMARTNWDRAVRRCLQRDPAKRYSDVRKVLAELEVRSRTSKLWRRMLRESGAFVRNFAIVASILCCGWLVWWLWPVRPNADAVRGWHAGIAALQAGEPITAAAILEDTLARHRLPEVATAQLAHAWFTAGFPVRAERALFRARWRPFQSESDRGYIRAVEALLSGQPADARNIFEDRARKLQGLEQTAAIADLAAFEETLDKPEAAARWQRILKLQPSSAVAHLWNAIHQMKDGDTAAAGNSFLASETYIRGFGSPALSRLVSARRGLANIQAGLPAMARPDIPALEKLPVQPEIGKGRCQRVLTLMAGVDDRFAMPADPIDFVSDAIKKDPAYGPGLLYSFDEPAHQQMLFVSIPLPEVHVCAAQLEARIRRTGLVASNNDAIFLGADASERSKASATIRPWQNDIGALERIMNEDITNKVKYVLANSTDPHGPFLDIIAGQDTEIDYFKLMLVY